MRINELKKEVQKLVKKYNFRLKVEKTKDNIFIKGFDFEVWYTVASIGNRTTCVIYTHNPLFDNLPTGLKEELFDILVEFVRTPVDDREEVKKYQYRLKEKYLWIDKRLNLGNSYLNIQSFQDGSKQKVLDNRGNTDLFKAEFTDEEIKEVVEKFDVDLNMFDKVEVLYE